MEIIITGVPAFDEATGKTEMVQSGDLVDENGDGFTARLVAPGLDDKYWIQSSQGGLNNCIIIHGDSVLPNCTGYAYGRFMEIAGTTSASLSIGNAKNWYGNTGDGYARGQTPKLGAVACWGSGQYGHVAIVEGINYNSDGSVASITISESHWKADGSGPRFNTRTVKSMNNYISGFQGYIYNPGA